MGHVAPVPARPARPEVPWPLAVAAVASLAAAALSVPARRWDAVLVAVAWLGAAFLVHAWVRSRSRRVQSALSAATAVRSRVVSGDAGRLVAADDLAVGDVLDLRAGDVVGATASVSEVDGLLVDDYALAGDAPVPRRVAGAEVLRPGTLVLRGRATAVVTEVADPATAGGTPAGPSRGAVTSREGLRVLVVAAAASAPVALVSIVTGALRGDVPAGATAAAAVAGALAVVASAVLLAPLVGVRASHRLLAGGVAVRTPSVLDRLPAVDLVGVAAPEILRSDHMSVVRVWTVGGDVAELARLAVLGGDADGLGPDGPAERALVDWAVASGVDVPAARDKAPVAATVPWDAERRRVTTAHADDDGVLVVCIGSPDAVWPLLVTSADGVSAGAVAARPVAESWAVEGLHVIALATTRRTVVGNAAGRLEWGLRLLGLVALEAGPREGAVDAVSGLRGAGLDVAVLSSDHEATVGALAAAVGIQARGRGAGVVTGEGMGTGRWADDVRVLARLSPDRHRDVVARWQAAGHVVALSGRSVPETPALRRAHVGMCLGPADEGARAAADLVADGGDLGSVLSAVTVARRALRGTRLLLAVPAAYLAAVWLVALVGAATVPWVLPAPVMALGAVVVAAPAALLLADGRRPAADVPGRLTGRLTDASWALWVSAWAVPLAAVALLAGGLAHLLGGPPAAVAAAVVAGGLLGAGVVGARAVGAASHDSRPATRLVVVVAAAAVVVAAPAAAALDGRSGSWWPPVVALVLTAGLGGVAARRWPAA